MLRCQLGSISGAHCGLFFFNISLHLWILPMYKWGSPFPALTPAHTGDRVELLYSDYIGRLWSTVTVGCWNLVLKIGIFFLFLYLWFSSVMLEIFDIWVTETFIIWTLHQWFDFPQSFRVYLFTLCECSVLWRISWNYVLHIKYSRQATAHLLSW